MEALFALLIGAVVIGVACWAGRADFAFDRTLTVIILVWAYYTLSVPLDLWLGFDVRGSQRLPDLDDKAMFGSVVDVALYHIVFIVGLLLGYGGIRAALGAPNEAASAEHGGFIKW